MIIAIHQLHVVYPEDLPKDRQLGRSFVFSQNWLSEGLGWGMGLVGLQTFHWRIEISPGLLKRSAGYGWKREVSVPIATPRCFLLVDESFSGWWFQIFYIFTPIWGRFPIWLIFLRWVDTTNQFFSDVVFFAPKRLGFKTVLPGLTSACPWNLRSVFCKQSLDNGRTFKLKENTLVQTPGLVLLGWVF